MENKQTAVEWLYDRFLFAGYAAPTQWREQAKEIEKEKIKDAYLAGWDALANGKHQYSEDYYNEIYGKE